MIVEYTRYKIDEKRRTTFLSDYRKAAEFLTTSRNCLAHELTQCIEEEDHFILRLEWDSEEGHMEEFRKSSEFKSYFAVLRPYVNDIEEITALLAPRRAWKKGSDRGKQNRLIEDRNLSVAANWR